MPPRKTIATTVTEIGITTATTTVITIATIVSVMDSMSLASLASGMAPLSPARTCGGANGSIRIQEDDMTTPTMAIAGSLATSTNIVSTTARHTEQATRAHSAGADITGKRW